MAYPIDFVMTWVDGADNEWQKKKQKYRGKDHSEKNENEACRYRDWGILKYWFRAVEQNAPWVRYIYLVTDGQRPAFLNEDNPKLRCVKHADFMPEAYLPTFNSRAIEANLHRIEGLAEHFVYFNDDMYINRPIGEGYFFRDGKPCYRLLCRKSGFNANVNMHQHGRHEGMEAVWRHFGKRDLSLKHVLHPAYGLKGVKSVPVLLFNRKEKIELSDVHIPNPILKSTMCDVWNEEPELMERTSMQKFRALGSVNQYIFRYWDLMRGNFAPAGQDGERYDVCLENIGQCERDILTGINPLICVNDSELCDDFEQCRDRLVAAFEKRYPEKSSFEK